MPDGKLGAVEARFADLVWENAPIGPLLGHAAHLARERMDVRLARYANRSSAGNARQPIMYCASSATGDYFSMTAESSRRNFPARAFTARRERIWLTKHSGALFRRFSRRLQSGARSAGRKFRRFSA